jgi:hypothetical protein
MHAVVGVGGTELAPAMSHRGTEKRYKLRGNR